MRRGRRIRMRHLARLRMRQRSACRDRARAHREHLERELAMRGLDAIARHDRAVSASIELHARSLARLREQGLGLSACEAREVVDIALAARAPTHARIADHRVPRLVAGLAMRRRVSNPSGGSTSIFGRGMAASSALSCAASPSPRPWRTSSSCTARASRRASRLTASSRKGTRYSSPVTTSPIDGSAWAGALCATISDLAPLMFTCSTSPPIA